MRGTCWVQAMCYWSSLILSINVNFVFLIHTADLHIVQPLTQLFPIWDSLSTSSYILMPVLGYGLCLVLFRIKPYHLRTSDPDQVFCFLGKMADTVNHRRINIWWKVMNVRNAEPQSGTFLFCLAQKFKSDKERERGFFGVKFKPQMTFFFCFLEQKYNSDGERKMEREISASQLVSSFHGRHISRSSSRLPSLSDGYVGQETPFAFQFGLDNVSLPLPRSLSLSLCVSAK